MRLAAVLLLLCASGAGTADAGKPDRVLLIGQGPDGHPAATHEYSAGMRVLAKLLNRAADIQTVVVSADGDWAHGPELLDGADAAVVFVSQGGRWIQEDAARLAAFESLAARGSGLTCLHWGMGTREAKFIPAWLKLFGGCHGGPDRRYQVVETKLQPTAVSHPVLRGVVATDVHDEFYFELKFQQPVEQITPLMRVRIDGQPHVVSWAWERPDGGRSFGFTGLHFHRNWKHAAYRRLMLQGVLWTLGRQIPVSGQPVDIADADLELPSPAAK